MIVLTPAVARTWEEKSLQAGDRMKDLMRQAVDGALRELRPFLPQPSTALILVGSGHNGDDALLLGLELKELGWDVDFLLSHSPGRRTHPDPRVKAKHWKKATLWPAKPSRFLKTRTPRLVIDGLLGLGATPPPRPTEAGILNWITREKRRSDLYVALDLPSGLHPATGQASESVFPADLTLALGSVKSGCLKDSALPWVGQIRAVPIDFAAPTPKPLADFFLPCEAHSILPARPAKAHKRSSGVVHLWAGSSQFPGAAALTSMGSLRSGAGYVRLFADRPIPESLSPSMPELLLHPLEPSQHPPLELFLDGATALVIGPGLPPSADLEKFLTQLLPQTTIPIVLDAGALEVVARQPQILTSARGPILLTPHAGELSRLLDVSVQDRAESALVWLKKFPSTFLIAKGPHSLVAGPDHPLSFNSTGGPAQATAGMGDLLAGLLGGLLAQGIPPFDAARLAVLWHGLASDLALRHGGPSTLASDLSSTLSTAWRILAGRAE